MKLYKIIEPSLLEKRGFQPPEPHSGSGPGACQLLPATSKKEIFGCLENMPAVFSVYARGIVALFDTAIPRNCSNVFEATTSRVTVEMARAR